MRLHRRKLFLRGDQFLQFETDAQSNHARGERNIYGKAMRKSNWITYNMRYKDTEVVRKEIKYV